MPATTGKIDTSQSDTEIVNDDPVELEIHDQKRGAGRVVGTAGSRLRQHQDKYPPLRCAYVDAEVLSLRELGVLHEWLTGHPAQVGTFGLMTCQRVEVYALGAPPEHPLVGALRCTDGLSALRRICEIAAGLRSQIVGERFVLEQVVRARAAVKGRAQLGRVIDEAIDVARDVRRRYGLLATVDYPDLAQRLLSSAGGQPGQVLVVVGGGMLAQAVATHPLAERYSKLVLASRTPKRLRKRLAQIPGLGGRAVVSSYRNLAETVAADRYDAVLATTNHWPVRDELVHLLSGPGCRSVVDLCSVPLLDPPEAEPRYVHMYAPEFLALVAEENRKIEPRAELARREIAGWRP